MSRLAEEIPVSSEPDIVPDGPGERSSRHDVANFVVIAAHSVLMRIGWIFKTETIVMPACLSAIGAGPALLAWQPVLMRIGLSVPPLLYATHLKKMERKKYSVAWTTFAMAIVFGVMAALWLTGVWGEPGAPAAWMPYAFLGLYGVFHCLTGLNQIGAHTLQGKLVRPDRRGRLFAVSVVVGAPLAIGAVWWLLPGWLALPDGGFGWTFAAVAALFVVSAGSILLAKEPRDDFTEESTNAWQKFHAAWRMIRSDRNCRRLSLVAVMMSANFMLFPYYQSLGRDEFEQPLSAIMLWVCVQNAATTLFSLVAGPLADRLGNRAALRLTVTGLAMAPATAVALHLAPSQVAEAWFWLIFVPLGLTPVSLRFLINYTLEIAPDDDHPRYVSAIGMCLALPVIVGSPFVGLLVSGFGCVPVMFAGLAVLLAAGMSVRRLVEPRVSGSHLAAS